MAVEKTMSDELTGEELAGIAQKEVRRAGPDRPCATGGTLIYHISILDILGWQGPDGEGNFNAAPGAQPQISPH